MDDQLELLIEDIEVPTHPSGRQAQEMVDSRAKRAVEGSERCLIDGILGSEYVESVRGKVLARKRARTVQETERGEELEPPSQNSHPTSRDGMAFESKEDGIGDDMDSALMEIVFHELSTICGKLVSFVKTKIAAAEKSKLECQIELERVKVELEQVRTEKERAEMESAALRRRAFMYLDLWIGAKEKLFKLNEEQSTQRKIEVVELVELGSRRQVEGEEIVADDGVIVQVRAENTADVVSNVGVETIGLGQVGRGNQQNFDFDLNEIPKHSAEHYEELEEGEIPLYA